MRDQNILKDLERFRVLDRDQLIEIHFSDKSNKIDSCNKVMRRLVNNKKVRVDRSTKPFHYFPNESKMKINSSKLFHFKAITDLFIEASKLGEVELFEVEFKTGDKGEPEPDALMKWRPSERFNYVWFFVELQLSVYSQKVMNDKFERYKTYYNKELNEIWEDNTPHVLMITDRTYKAPKFVVQMKSFTEFHSRYKPKPKPIVWNME